MDVLIVAAGFVLVAVFLGFRLYRLGEFLDHSALHPYPCDTIGCEKTPK